MFKLKNRNLSFFVLLPLVLFVFAFNNPQKKLDIQKNLLVQDESLKFRVVNESSTTDKSEDKFWWLNSGGKVYFGKNIIKTIQGDLPSSDYWRQVYSKSNSKDTDNGYHPQNIFRLVSKSKYQNPTQSMYFKINKYILSQSNNRNASNGVFFFNNYEDGNNFYYAGIRVDGHAVIKKKTNGTYYTMAYTPVFTEKKYNVDQNPILIPKNKWIGIKSEIKNLDSKKVQINLYLDKDESGKWQLLASVIDDGKKFGGGNFVIKEGNIGIRSDFMDIEFKNYEIK